MPTRRRSSAADSAEEVEEAGGVLKPRNEDESPERSPEKRGRGRPRKQPPTEAKEDAPPPKPRGRPPKAQSKPAEEEKPTEDGEDGKEKASDESQPLKRGRGRPPKKTTEDKKPEAKEEAEEEPEPVNEPAAKSTASEEKVLDLIETPAEKVSEATAPQKRGRGRPLKKSAEPTESAEAEAEADKEDEPEKTKEKVTRGKKRGRAAVEEKDDGKEEEDDDDVTEDDEEEEPEPAPKRARAPPPGSSKGRTKSERLRTLGGRGKKVAGPALSAANAKTTAKVMARAAGMAEPSSNSSLPSGLSNLQRMEAIRQRNIDEKMKMLQDLGLMEAKSKLAKVTPKPPKSADFPAAVRAKVKRRPLDVSKLERRSSGRVRSRKSYADMDDGEINRRARRGEGADKDYRFSDSDEEEADGAYSPEEAKRIRKRMAKGEGMEGVMVSDASLYKYQRPAEKPPEFFGHAEGVPMGEMFISRMEASYALVHRPPVAGIAGGAAKGGAFSICLSGGGDYNEDLDFGHCFTFSGAGGRELRGTKANPKNLRCAPQTKDQELEGVNLALSMNVETGRPVRVIRGFRLDSPYAPKWGYRYDGLYEVKEWRYVRGSSGHKVITYALKRCEDQEPPPWEVEEEQEQEEDEDDEGEGEKKEKKETKDGDKMEEEEEGDEDDGKEVPEEEEQEEDEEEPEEENEPEEEEEPED